MKILLVSEMSECEFIGVLFIQVESISSLVLTPHNIVQGNRSGNRDAVKDEESSPKLGIVLTTRLTLDKLRTYDIADTVGNEDGSRHETLLGCACYIRHAQSDEERDDGTEEADYRVSHYWSCGVVRLVCFPDHAAASYD
jgi:hypothetical protein